MDSLLIVMPAYNEEKRIGPTIEAYANYFDAAAKQHGFSYTLFVVINNTTDSTESIVIDMQNKHSAIDYINIPKGGKGHAVITGFLEGLKNDFSHLGFVDADMATNPDAFFRLFLAMRNIDAVMGSRYIKGAIIDPPPTIQRIIASRIFNSLIRALFFLPYRDTQCGAKIFRREALESILPFITMSQWAFDVEMIYLLHKKGFRVREIPTTWSDKGYSKINFLKAGPKMALGIIRLRLLNSPFHFFMRIYDFIVRFSH